VNDPNEKALNWNYLLTETYRIYWERFGTFFRIAFVPALLAYFLHYVARMTMHRLVESRLRFGTALYLGVVISAAENAAYWVLSGFLLAAIASRLLRENPQSSHLLSDDYSHARERLTIVFVVGLSLSLILFIGRGVAGFALYELLDRLHVVKNPWISRPSSAVMVLILAGLLSRFSLIIPEAVRDRSLSLGRALRNSIRKTEGWESFFMAFLVKSAAVGYAVFWLSDRALDLLWEHDMVNVTVAQWIDRAVQIGVAAALESPLFIALSILCRDWKPAPEEAYTPPPIG
jgi:hypothetical protein